MHRRERDRRHRVRPGRAAGHPARRRGDPGDPGVPPRRPRDAAGPAGGAPAGEARLHAPGSGATATSATTSSAQLIAQDRRLARHRDRARLLDGARPTGRPGRRRLPDGRGAVSGRAGRQPGPAGDVAGILSFVPWGRDGYSLDVMRRNPQADNGVTEFMVAGLMAGRPGDRHPPGLAELRGLPVRLRGGRPDRRRTDPPAVAAAAAGRLALVADRVAVPLQREVPA